MDMPSRYSPDWIFVSSQLLTVLRYWAEAGTSSRFLPLPPFRIEAEGIEEETIREANLPCGDDMEEDEGEVEEGGEGDEEGEGVRVRGYGGLAVSSKEEALAGERAVRAELETLKGTVNLSSIAE